MEEASVGTVELVQTVHRVLAGVAVDDVEQDHDAHPVGHIDQLLQILQATVTTGNIRNI